ncbi:hypothetical protein AMS68_008045 [Peltaster fructicola]|uniref:SPX domain-containing protein n=1 Tax=Peltaster fructicola TaxID=286661 RepID=A0A6H0Y6N9_9PEZI|nr:hypothetical protein AMS68_008045 [Peltaster fructicola]
MKFAKELDENAVPEWKSQYLNYKIAKKKLKAVERALRSADKTPNTLPTPFSSSLRDAPVFSFLQRKPDDNTNDSPLRLTRSRSEASNARPSNESVARSTPRPIPVNERSPLRQAEDVTTKSGQPMRRYGSIIGTPPEHDDLTMTRSNQVKPVSLLELPGAALDPNKPKHVQPQDDPEYDRPLSPGSPHIPPASQLAHTGNAYKVTKPQDHPNALAAPRLRQLFRKDRTSSMPSDSRPFVKRMFSISGPVTKPRNQDVALEAYREVDFRTEEFFLYLDKQLEKVESFYSAKETEATERLLAIREQLHILRDRRWQEIVAHEERQRAERGPSTRTSAEVNPKDRRLSSWMAPVDNAVTHMDNAWDRVRGSYVGKTSRRMEELASPIIPSSFKPEDLQDYVRRPISKDVPYRIAKRKLKMALAEFYRALELLKSYSLLNRTAFRKINKKYDKTVNAHPPMRYMEKVNKSHFVNSDVVDGQLHAVEDLYARYFERGNHKVAVTKLRSKIARAEDYTGSIWRQGVLLAAGSVFAVEGLVYGILDLYQGDNEYEFQRASYLLQLYAGYFFIVLLSAFFVLDARIFEKNKVNYQFVFEFVRPINWRQLSEIPAYFFFLLGLFMWLNFKHFGGDTMYIYWPVILIGLSAILLFAPPPFFYPKSRSWLLYTNWRLFLSGLYPVEFRDFFFGDMFCSLTYSLGNIELFFCLYAQHWNDVATCNSTHSRLLGFFSTLPGIFRALQCLRRYWDTRNVFPHLVNCGKYTFTILYYMSLSLYRIDDTTEFQALFIVFATINAVYCSIWDILMDWSLLDLESKNFLLRDTLAYKQKWYYYAAMPIDVMLRFNWIFYAIFAADVGHASVVSFCVALSEVCRRGIWVIFRVENEHCTNVRRARASRDVPLPYPVSPSTESVDKSPEAQEARRQGIRLDHEESAPSAQSTASGADPEQGTAQTPSSLRRRGTFAADSPVMRTLRRVGSTIASAHAQDYERKRKPDNTAAADSDASSDSDDDLKKKPDPKKHRDTARERQREFEELPEEDALQESPDEVRNRRDIAAAEDAVGLARGR